MNTRAGRTSAITAALLTALALTACAAPSQGDSSTTSLPPASAPATPTPASSNDANDPTTAGGTSTDAERTDAERTAFVDALVAAQLPVDQAEKLIVDNGYTFRQGPADGQVVPLTADYRPDRITVATTDGIVTDASWG